jgi:hypothetical protein
MTPATSKLPDTLRFDPHLAEALEDLLRPHGGANLEKAQAAVVKLRKSGLQAPLSGLIAAYRDAIKAAVK